MIRRKTTAVTTDIVFISGGFGPERTFAIRAHFAPKEAYVQISVQTDRISRAALRQFCEEFLEADAADYALETKPA